ncbi:acyltransferase family protein [Nocardioides cavernaquae]|uniref:Acyltransferase n=1 Tax=Nocardioides cavernaquae TaxID=2321396 RepID=A0A3A5H584_9ACTN|nr:acyltransferase family protein [Nocardioides cavernaquae]RJS45071.1 acyltransferase [Nocardioides cavernaquae]
MSWQHRPSLDGLRTIAVYLVLCFHGGVVWADGGFVGVDLFFVLSGFLVSSILLEELATTGKVRIGAFYARRVRRLLPAALVVVTVTSLVFLLVAPIVRRLPWVGDAQASLLYVANWRFLSQSDDYFAGAGVVQSPFLHFWSLAVEEQFYLLFPFLLLGLAWARKRWAPALTVGIAALMLASIAAQVFWATRDADHAYYGTDARIYQPLAGVLAAIAWRRLATRPRALRHSGWVFLGLLLLTATSLVPWNPSVRGLVATAASVGLILATMTRTTPGLDRLLSLAPLTWLGRISYGTYLWHWPVLLLIREGIDAPAWVDATLTAAIATGLAALSFELLENPVRRSELLARFAPGTVVVGLACSVLAAYTVVPAALQNDAKPALALIPATAPGVAAAAPAAAASGDKPVPAIDWQAIADSKGAETSYCTLSDTTSCIAHQGGSDLHVMLVGDSHARVLSPTLEKIAEQQDFTLSTSMVAACPWQQGVVSRFSNEQEKSDCVAARSALYGGLLDAMDIDVVVLTEMPRSSDTWQHGLIATDGSNLPIDKLNLNTMTSSLQTIRKAGARSVVVESWIVRYDDVNPLECLSGASRIGQCTVPAPPAPLTDSFARTLAAGSPGITTLSINDIVCPGGAVCAPVLNDIPVWRDSKHYSTEVLLDHVKEIRARFLATGYFG